MLKMTQDEILAIATKPVPPLPDDASEQDKAMHSFYFIERLAFFLSQRAQGAYAEMCKVLELPEAPEPGQVAMKHGLYYSVALTVTDRGAHSIGVIAHDDGHVEATKMTEEKLKEQ